MRASLLKTMPGLLWLLCLAVFARGQTAIPITGPTPVCRDSAGIYSAPRTTGINYTWSVTVQGNLLSTNIYTTTTASSVQWVGAGSATVTVQGRDSSGALVQLGSKIVNVLPRPAPYITQDVRVGCQKLGKDTDGEQPRDDDGSCLRVCEYSQVVYTPHGSPGSTYTWNVTGAVTYNTSGPVCTVDWGAAGGGSVTVTETTVNGCVGIKTICVEKIQKPKARFFAMPDSTLQSIVICKNATVTFIDRSDPLSGSPLITWLWDFGDGGTYTSSGPSPVTHTFTTPGVYRVTLTVRNQCNCTDTYEMRVIVKDEEGVKIECPGVVCEGAHAKYSVDRSLNCNQYPWSVQGGTIVSGQNTNEIEVEWNNVDASGFGYVTFDPSGCEIKCPAITTIRVPVVQTKGTIDGPQVICPFKGTLFRLPQWPTTDFQWEAVPATGVTLQPTGQRNEVLVTANSGVGTFTLKCYYKNTLLGCGGTANIIVTVQPPVNFIGQTVACQNTSSTYTLSGGALATWTLNLPNGTTQTSAPNVSSYSPTFSLPGVYTLSVSGAFCAPDPLNITVKAPPAVPDSLLGPATACAGVPTAYVAKNNIAGTVFAWSATPGTVVLNTTAGATTYATFPASPTTYTISVRRERTDLPGCASALLTKTITAPVVNPTVTGNTIPCASSYWSYSANYTAGETYEWSVFPATQGSVSGGNGTPVAQILWNNVVGSSAPAKVIVKVRKCQTVKYDTLNVVVYATPTVTATGPDTVCRDAMATFGITSVPPLSSGSIAWTFSDVSGSFPGVNSTTSSVTHTFSALSTSIASYTATVTVTNGNGCSGTSSSTKTVWVKPSPVANLSPAGPLAHCDTTTISDLLTATVNTGYGGTTMYTWYRNGVVIPAASCSTCSTYVATQLGDYYVIVTNSFGCTAKTNTVNVRYFCPGSGCTFSTPPSVVVTSASVTSCGKVSATATYSAGGSNPGWNYPALATGYTVTPGSGTSSATFTFNVAGNYDFDFHATYLDINGQPCIVAYPFSVVVPYIAKLNAGISCTATGYKVTLVDNSNFYPGYAPTTYRLYVDNMVTPVVTSATSPTYTGSLTPGSHTFKIKLSRSGYPDCEDIQTVNLPALPVAAFTASRTVACITEAPIALTNTSTPGALSSFWTFGDGSSNNQTNVSKVYSSLLPSQFKTILLTVTGAYGCVDTQALVVKIVADSLNGQLTASPTPCEGNPVTLTYSPTGTSNMADSFAWSFNNSLFLKNTVNTINVYDPGGYGVHAVSKSGCYDDPAVVPVSIVQVPDPVITGDSSQCYAVGFTLYGYAGPGSFIYEWTQTPGGLISTAPNLTLGGLATGTYTYVLTIKVPKPGGGYCSKSTAPFVVTVWPQPAAPTINPPSPINCDPYTLQLSANAPGPGTLNWSDGSTGNPITVSSGGFYRVWFTDIHGCISQGDAMIPRDPKSYLWIFPSGCYALCKDGFPYTLLGPNESFVYWDWLRAGASDYSGSGFVAPYSLPAPDVYNLVLDNGLCQATSDPMDVQVKYCDRPCQRIDIKDPRVKVVPGGLGCNRYITFTAYNNWGIPLSYDVTVTNGALAPGAGTLMPGGNSLSLNFIPDPGFTSGVVYVTLTVHLPDGSNCTVKFAIDMPSCQGTPYRYASPGSGNQQDAVGVEAGQSLLILAPNPSSDATVISYRFASVSDAARSIDVYDVAGRVIAHHVLNNMAGDWTLPTADLAPGMYVVSLNQNGRTVLQAKLSVIH